MNTSSPVLSAQHIDDVANWLHTVGGHPNGVYDAVDGYTSDGADWHTDPRCVGIVGAPQRGQWLPRTTLRRHLCRCTRRHGPDGAITVGPTIGAAINVWWHDHQTHGTLTDRVNELTARELVTYAHTVSVAGHLHPALRDRVAAELAEREADIQLLLLAHGATPCQTAGDRIYDDTRPDGHTTVNWNSWLDTTGELAEQILRADNDTYTAPIAAFIDRVCDPTSIAQHTTAAELASWSETWTAPWHTSSGDHTTVVSWLIAETAARLRVMLGTSLIAWADELRTSWQPLLDRRYLIQNIVRGSAINSADLEHVCQMRRLNSGHASHRDICVVDGATAVFAQRPAVSYINADGIESRLAGKWADVTDDTDTVLHTALGLIDDGVPLIDALATARALHT
jgi:hypothetical protein